MWPVACGADGEAEALRGAHGLHDVVRAAGDDDRDGALVDGEVPRGAGLVPAGVARDGDASGDPVVEQGERFAQREGHDVVVARQRLGDVGDRREFGAVGGVVDAGVVVRGGAGGHRGVHGRFLSRCRGRGPRPSRRRRTAAGNPGGSHERKVHLTTNGVADASGGSLRVSSGLSRAEPSAE